MRCGRKLNLTNVDSEHLEEATSRKNPSKYHKAWETLSRSQGVSAHTQSSSVKVISY